MEVHLVKSKRLNVGDVLSLVPVPALDGKLAVLSPMNLPAQANYRATLQVTKRAITAHRTSKTCSVAILAASMAFRGKEPPFPSLRDVGSGLDARVDLTQHEATVVDAEENGPGVTAPGPKTSEFPAYISKHLH